MINLKRINRLTQLLSLLLLFAFVLPTQAQVKKRIKYYELDLIRGLYYQPNTAAPYEGTAYDEYPNGKKKLEIPFKGGKMHGTVKEWEKNGEKVYQVEYVAGKKIGKEEQWHPTGKKLLELNYVDGLADGICTEWHKNEAKKSEGLFRQGKEEGEHNWWYADGTKDQTITYQNGLIEGSLRNWHPNGKKKLESNYKKGQLHGTSEEWYGNGQKKWIANYVDNEKHGESYNWGKYGQLFGKQVYKNGKLVEDYNYRSGNIKLINGYVQVFNKPKSFYHVKITGNKVNEADDKNNIIYSVDGQFLRIYDIPADSVSTQKIAEKELLEKFSAQEQKLIEKQLGQSIDIESAFGKTKQGQTYLHWSFVSPSSKEKEQKPRTVQKEHYISMLCEAQILNLHSIVTNSDEPSKIVSMIKGIADSVVVEKERIDLNAFARKAK